MCVEASYASAMTKRGGGACGEHTEETLWIQTTWTTT